MNANPSDPIETPVPHSSPEGAGTTAQPAVPHQIKEMTDTDLLRRLNLSQIRLEQVTYLTTLDALLESLEDRVTHALDDGFSNDRLKGLCGTTNRMACSYRIATGHFMRQGGINISGDERLLRIFNLLDRIIYTIEKRSKKKAASIEDWANQRLDISSTLRILVARALSFLLAQSYEYNLIHVAIPNAINIVEQRLDLAIYVPSFHFIRFQSSKDPLLNILNERRDDLCNLFFGVRSNTKSEKPGFIHIANHPAEYKLIFDDLVRNLIQFKSLDAFSQWARRHYLDCGRTDEFAINTLHRDAYFIDNATLDSGNDLIETELRNPRLLFQNNLDLARAFLNSGHYKLAKNLAREIDVTALAPTDIPSYLDIARLLDFDDRLIKFFQKEMAEPTDEATTSPDPFHVSRRMIYERESIDHLVIKDYRDLTEFFIRNGLIDPNSGENLSEGDHILLFCTQEDRVGPNLVAPLLPILSKNGMKFRNLVEDEYSNTFVKNWEYGPRLSFDFRHVSGKPADDKTYLMNWEINPKERIISADGINVFEGIYERVSRCLKVFDIDWNAPATRHYFSFWMRQTDRLLFCLNDVLRVAKEKNIRITLFSLLGHYAPYFAMKAFAEVHSDYFSHVTLSSAYENWRSNVSGHPLTTLAFINNTRNPTPSQASFGTRNSFETWYEKQYLPNKSKYDEISDSVTLVNRSGETNDYAKALLTELASHKNNGKTILCALGKIPYDLAVPYQGGPAHRDMKDWLNHTVSLVNDCSDTILLVKPHPHEVNFSISNCANQGFLDLVEVDCGQNITRLAHRGLNLQDLAEYVDLFLCWNGSSIAELGAQGHKIVAADDWAAKNYPINVFMPNDRPHYENIISNPKTVQMKDDFFELSRAYTAFLVEASFAIDYPYCKRSSTNVDFNRCWINWTEISKESLDRLQMREQEIVDAFIWMR
ncbi:hypothetical protein [Stappia sp.]|uniref:hypothetical protein n=1 Tax=Stappia sp. TaxID=1870903 RepID=UPI0032D90349